MQKGATAGAHGLPLMGGGDWNDGMNRVGIQGRGESIWLGWFLVATLTNFAPLAEQMDDAAQAEKWRDQARHIRQALEEHGWDGEWYRRAYYDDGTPLGSAQNEECRIDAIAQSWGVISGAAQPDRAAASHASGQPSSLVRARRSPACCSSRRPSTRPPRDPGYIKGYPPGIRENGGQYTHAALWTAWAFAKLGQGDRAADLFGLINPVYHSDGTSKAARYG